MISFRFIDFRNRRKINEIENEYAIFDEIKSKWQRETKIAWSKEKILVTNEDLDSQMNLDESEDERSINKWLRKIFYIISWISHSF
jgi:hypothetical protein